VSSNYIPLFNPIAIERIAPTSILWQAGEMAKAYRSDVCGKEKFQREVALLEKSSKPERVRCPVADCERTYAMYGCLPSNREGNIATLLERLTREHPGHTSEVLAVNEFRRPAARSAKL
jgi:hypothetical protein